MLQNGTQPTSLMSLTRRGRTLMSIGLVLGQARENERRMQMENERRLQMEGEGDASEESMASEDCAAMLAKGPLDKSNALKKEGWCFLSYDQ